MSEAASVAPWLLLALAAGFGAAWLLFRRGAPGGKSGVEEQFMSLRGELRDNLKTEMQGIREGQESLETKVRGELAGMRKDSAAEVEKLRELVQEKLQATLEQRISSSFSDVSKRLKEVDEGIGHMKAVGENVAGLKQLLAGVSTRGVFGEYLLGSLLDECLTPGQYEKNVRLGDGIVEYAICLPNSEDESAPLYLPLDAKFPLEPYRKQLEDAEDKRQDSKVREELARELRKKADEIKKYISPPVTTSFALMYLPIESIYAEALRCGDAWMDIQRKQKVIIVGPTTLYALLHSLQVGFKSIAISKRTSEVWETLQKVELEFKKFEEAIGQVRKKADATVSSINSADQRIRVMGKALSSVASLEGPEAPAETAAEESSPSDRE